MSALTDEDGVDGPFNKRMAKLPRESRDAKKARLKYEAEQIAELGKAVDQALAARQRWYDEKPLPETATNEDVEAWSQRVKDLQAAYRSEQNGVLMIACHLTGRRFT